MARDRASRHGIVVAALLPLLVPSHSSAEEAGARTVELDEPVGAIRYLTNERIAAWGSGSSEVLLIDPQDGSVTPVASADGAMPVDVVAVGDGEGFIALERPEGDGQRVVVTEYDATGEATYSIAIDDPMRVPSLHRTVLGNVEALILADANSSVLTVLPDPAERARGGAGGPLKRADLKEHNIYLEQGPASDVLVDPDGAFIATYHPHNGTLSVTGTRPAQGSFPRRLGQEPLKPDDLAPVLGYLAPSNILGMNGRPGIVVLDHTRQFIYLIAYDQDIRRPIDMIALPYSSPARVPAGADARALLGIAEDVEVGALAISGTGHLLLTKLEANAFYPLPPGRSARDPLARRRA